MRKLLFLVLLFAALETGAKGQELDLPQGALKDEATLARVMPLLAKQAIAIYQEPDLRMPSLTC